MFEAFLLVILGFGFRDLRGPELLWVFVFWVMIWSTVLEYVPLGPEGFFALNVRDIP